MTDEAADQYITESKLEAAVVHRIKSEARKRGVRTIEALDALIVRLSSDSEAIRAREMYADAFPMAAAAMSRGHDLSKVQRFAH